MAALIFTAPRAEWRIAGVDRLVLMTSSVTQPTSTGDDQQVGMGTFFVLYTAAGGLQRKLRLGRYHPEHFTLREARAAATEALAAINRGADPVGDAKEKAHALTFKAMAEQFLNEAPHLAATTARMARQVRAALQAWSDHVWSITGQGSAVTNVVELKKSA
jgi:Arm DNA-binding domain